MRIPDLPSGKKAWILWAVVALAAAAGLLLFERLLGEIDLDKLLGDIAVSLGAWTYVIAGVMAFLETGAFVGLVAPGETIVILAGAMASTGVTSLELTMAIIWLSAWLGDTASFFLGARLGRGFILTHGPKFRISRERFEQVERYFASHGGKTILIGRFIGIIRALAPFIAGTSNLPYRSFLPYSVIGTGLWAGLFTLIGYFGANALNEAKEYAGRGTIVFATLVGIIVGCILLVRWMRVPANRATAVKWMDRRRSLHWLVNIGRKIRPQAQFVWHRLTPGDLGLELTTLLAVLAVSSYAAIAYCVVISGSVAPTPTDNLILGWARDLETPTGVDIAKVLIELGSLWVVGAVALVTGLVLALRRRWLELAGFVAGLALIAIGLVVLSQPVDRPHPADSLIPVSGNAYPAAGAAWSATYLWVALIVTVRIRPGMVGASAVVTMGALLGAASGVAAVYLRAFHPSDVIGGWGLGVAAFALAAAAAVVFRYVRSHNGDRAADPDPLSDVVSKGDPQPPGPGQDSGHRL